jgi:hypothetical protein
MTRSPGGPEKKVFEVAFQGDGWDCLYGASVVCFHTEIVFRRTRRLCCLIFYLVMWDNINRTSYLFMSKH